MASIAVAGRAIVAATTGRRALVDVVEIALGGDDVAPFPHAGAAVLTLAQARDALAPVAAASTLLEGRGRQRVDVADLHGDRDLLGGGGILDRGGQAEGGRQEGESNG